MTLVMMSLPLAHVFQCLLKFGLVYLLCADWWKSDSSVNGEPQGNWRWNSSSEDVVASSPSSFHPADTVPQRACSQAMGAHTGTQIT